jgi:sterol desaturase/sphingolipid hydroxylase (fatty acid hydroxylase superfamily)
MIIFYFLIWTLLLYGIHRLIHVLPVVRKFHEHHHKHILQHGNPGYHWTNLLLINTDWKSTLDLWITEVLPTLMFSYIFQDYTLFIFYWIWASLLQEKLEHNPGVDVYPITTGSWHLKHHYNPQCNYGLFIPVWDKLFQTEKK